jgi:hypothetical protein
LSARAGLAGHGQRTLAALAIDGVDGQADRGSRPVRVPVVTAEAARRRGLKVAAVTTDP